MEGASIGAGALKHRYSGDSGMRPSRADVVEQWARQSSGHAQRLSSAVTSTHRRGSEGKYLIGNILSPEPRSLVLLIAMMYFSSSFKSELRSE